jgi:hypothetical protein
VSINSTSQPMEGTPNSSPLVPSKDKAWYVIRRGGPPEIAVFVNAKGSCSYRRFRREGMFIGRLRSKGEFGSVFSGVIADGIRFFPASQPALEAAERNGLPAYVLETARGAFDRL